MQGPHLPQSETLPSTPAVRPARRPSTACLFASSTPGQSPGLRPRRGFTLTELLIVIAIIGVLASLIAVAAKAALDNMHRNRTLLTIKNIGGSLEDFKNEYGSYPPNGMHNNDNDLIAQVANDFVRTMKKAFPRMHRDEEALLRAIAGQSGASGPSFVLNSSSPDGGVTASEALVLWLGGFSDDPQYPLSGPGGPSFADDPDTSGVAGDEILEDRNWQYQFELTQLTPRDDDGVYDGRFVAYNIDLNGDGQNNGDGETRQINLWQFAPTGSEQPLVYFDASRYKPALYDPSAEPLGELDYVFALKKLREGKSADASNLTLNDIAFVNQGKFQILHCGLDDDWGGFGTSVSSAANVDDVTLLFPEGPFIGAVADTLSNVIDGKLEDAAEE